MVIVIAGTTEPLFFQTRDRLIKTLRLESRPRDNPWRHISQPKLREDSHVMIRETLLQWNSPTATPEERRTVRITVMKHHRHLQNLIDVLRQVNVPNVPTLIIDDEGDQAGMNTLVNQGEESTTYRRLLALKAALPHHSYLQFTATPQAPLLISIVDVLSPSFAEILNPGIGYVGGAEFFLNQQNLVRDIPVNQIPAPNNLLNAPPATLLDAMRLFFTGVAIGYLQGQPDRNCKDRSGNPVLLIQAENDLPGTAAPLVLEHLCVIHLVNCRVQSGDQGEQQKTLSIIRCTDPDRAIHEYFLRCLHPIVASLPQSPSRDQISDAVQKLVDLFRRMADAPRKAAAGLWAELFVIARSSNPACLLAAWHAIPEEKFDFANGIDRLDVKAASGELRLHQFTLDQLRPAVPVRVLIASLMTERCAGGTSLNDLVDSIRARVADPDHLIRLDSAIAQTLGQDWRAMQQTRFDLQQAVQSLRFIDAATVPSVANPTPPEVSAVHFRVDLSQHPMPFPDASIQASGLFRAAVPCTEA
jgi:hypothetical protein